jgi:hypothetical protein
MIETGNRDIGGAITPEIIFNRMSVLQNPVRLVDERRQAAGLES